MSPDLTKFLMHVLPLEEMPFIYVNLHFSKDSLKAKDLQGFWPLLIRQFGNMDLCMENERMSHRGWARKVTCLFYMMCTHGWHQNWLPLEWEGIISFCVPLTCLEQGNQSRCCGCFNLTKLSQCVYLKSPLRHLALFEICLWEDRHQVHLGNVMWQSQRSDDIQESVRDLWYRMFSLGFSEINKEGKLFRMGWGGGEWDFTCF